MSDNSTPLPSPTTPPTIRGIMLAVIVGVLIFNWWSERQQPPAPLVTDTAHSTPAEPTSDNATDEQPDRSDSTTDENESTAKSSAEPTRKPVPSESRSTASVRESHPPATISTGPSKPSARGPPKTETKPKPATPSAKPDRPRVDGLKVHDVVIRNQDDEVVYRGTVDLAQTLERIDGERILAEFRHDGIEFRNFERRLPIKPRGHYREWVHPTQGQRGPGPQRVVTGKDGEAYYTWDHYGHFVRIRSGP